MCALHLNTVVCQLYLNITGPKNFLWENKKEKWPSCFCKNNICSLWRVLKWRKLWIKIVSVRFSRSVVSDSLQPHESQHARPPCPPTPGVHSNSCPSSRWCHPAISSSVVPFSSYPQTLPASESWKCQNEMECHRVPGFRSSAFETSKPLVIAAECFSSV